MDRFFARTSAVKYSTPTSTALAQPGQQRGAEPAPLPGIDQGHPQVGGVRLVLEGDEPELPMISAGCGGRATSASLPV